MTALRGMSVMALLLALPACSKEARVIASDQPQTPPNGPADSRAARYEQNDYQVSQGGRYFSWYGCSTCHGPSAKGALDLADGHWQHGGTIDRVYAFIADGHGAANYRLRIPDEQLWQLAAYVRSLPQTDAARTLRQNADEAAEPQGSRWNGPVG
jgi:mono/diheme cytochrome c family protein